MPEPSNKLPRQLVERGTEIAQEMRFMRHRLHDLSRDELIAVAALGFEGEAQARAETRRRTEFMGDLMRVRGRK